MLTTYIDERLRGGKSTERLRISGKQKIDCRVKRPCATFSAALVRPSQLEALSKIPQSYAENQSEVAETKYSPVLRLLPRYEDRKYITRMSNMEAESAQLQRVHHIAVVVYRNLFLSLWRGLIMPKKNLILLLPKL